MLAPVDTFKFKILAVTTLRDWLFAVRMFALNAFASVETVRYVVLDPVETFRLRIFEVNELKNCVFPVRIFALATLAI